MSTAVSTTRGWNPETPCPFGSRGNTHLIAEDNVHFDEHHQSLDDDDDDDDDDDKNQLKQVSFLFPPFKSLVRLYCT